MDIKITKELVSCYLNVVASYLTDEPAEPAISPSGNVLTCTVNGKPLNVWLHERSAREWNSKTFSFSSEFMENLKAVNARLVFIINSKEPKKILVWDCEKMEKTVISYDEYGEKILTLQFS